MSSSSLPDPAAEPTFFARTIQSIIVKYKLMDPPIVVVNKGGGTGSEGFVYGSATPDDPYKVTFGTNNEYLLPLVAKMGYTADSLIPVAALALDEFLIWVNAKSPYKDAKSFIEAAKKPEGLKMGGSQSKDTDQTLASMISAATGAKFTYIPFKSGGEAAVQLAGGHIDANINNPSENIGQWKASMVRRSAFQFATHGHRAPRSPRTWPGQIFRLCKDSGIPIANTRCRVPYGSRQSVADAVAFYTACSKR